MKKNLQILLIFLGLLLIVISFWFYVQAQKLDNSYTPKRALEINRNIIDFYNLTNGQDGTDTNYCELYNGKKIKNSDITRKQNANKKINSYYVWLSKVGPTFECVNYYLPETFFNLFFPRKEHICCFEYIEIDTFGF